MVNGKVESEKSSEIFLGYCRDIQSWSCMWIIKIVSQQQRRWKRVSIKYAYQMHFYGLDFYFAFRFRFLSPQEHNLICFTALRLSISCAILWRLSICFNSFSSIRDSATTTSRNLFPTDQKAEARHRIKASSLFGASQAGEEVSCCVLFII